MPGAQVWKLIVSVTKHNQNQLKFTAGNGHFYENELVTFGMSH